MSNTKISRIDDSQQHPALDHAQMHAQHLEWTQDNSMWRDDLAIWQREIKQARADLELLKTAFDEHEQRLRQHAAAVRLYEHDALQHEHALAEYERGESGTDLCAMARAHESEQTKHQGLLELHAEIKRQQHAIVEHWQQLLDVSSVKSCSRKCQQPKLIQTTD